MSEDRLDYLHSKVREHDDILRGQTRQAQLERLGAGPNPRRVNLAPQSGYEPRTAPGSPTDTLGNTLPYVGQANLLLDPLFTTIASTVSIGTSATPDGLWEAHYVLNSGSIADPLKLSSGVRAAPNNNPFNSGTAIISRGLGDTFDADVYLYPVTDFTPSQIPAYDFIVAAVRGLLPFGTAVMSAYSAFTAQLEIYDVGAAAVVGTQSQVLDFKAIGSDLNLQLVAYYQVDLTNVHIQTLRWRLHLHIAGNGGAASGQYPRFGEPQLHFSNTPDPVLFSPQIANWLVGEPDMALHDVTASDVSSTAHGFAPKSPANANTFLNGAATPGYAAVTEAGLTLADVTTDNVSTARHGFAPKAPNDATKFLDGTGAYSTPTGGVTPDVQIFGTPGAFTWTKPAGGQKQWRAYVVGGGAGAGSGRRGAAASARFGGGGGAPGWIAVAQGLLADLPATVAGNVGAGGNGGAQASANNTDGNPGSVGGASYFGTSSGAGCYAAADGASEVGAAGTATGGAGGSPAGRGIGTCVGDHIFNNSAFGGSIFAIPVVYAPASAIAGTSSTSAAASAGAGGQFLSGGGGGGGLDTANVARNGGNGGVPLKAPAATTAPVHGKPGTAGALVTAGGFASTGGAGADATGNNVGGAGGPGSGGGGGSASANGTASGAGGKGGDGQVIVVSW